MAAYELPHRRFALTFAGDDARLGADAVRYSFIVSDFHRLLLAGLPAHCEKARHYQDEAEPEGCGGSTAKDENEVWPDFRCTSSGIRPSRSNHAANGKWF